MTARSILAKSLLQNIELSQRPRWQLRLLHLGRAHVSHQRLAATGTAPVQPDEPPSFRPTCSYTAQSSSGTDTSSSSAAFKVAAAWKPVDLVKFLDQFVIGQVEAKRAVAIALRSRWRRRAIKDETIASECMPKNLLLIGPTGSGKTEIARRVAKLADAPFIKVEATKFTEVGFHGRDVDQIIKDLVEISVTMTKKRRTEGVKAQAERQVEKKVLHALTGALDASDSHKDHFLDLLRQGHLAERVIDVEVSADRNTAERPNVGAYGEASSISMADLIGRFSRAIDLKRPMQKKKLPIKDAVPALLELEMDRLTDMSDITKEAVQSVEQSGIVFVDEIDKICSAAEYRSADASAEGVQRDLLPLIEGCTISTKYGNVNTDFVLFICSGAFHDSKPSDLLAELQGRLPIRVELKHLSEDDLYRILTEPITSLLKQQEALLAAENVTLSFTDGAIREIARVAALVNRTRENIGARRLHTVLERIVEDVSFHAAEYEDGHVVNIDEEFVQNRVNDMLIQSELSKYILVKRDKQRMHLSALSAGLFDAIKDVISRRVIR